MVRGVVKRIVILKPDPKTGFEQAIFIVSDHERTGESQRLVCRPRKADGGMGKK